MSGFYKNTKQVSAGSTIEANVSPYGWTGVEAQSISQIIDYVNQCKGYAEEAAYSAKLAKDSELVIFEYVNEAKMWADRSKDAYEDARLEADRSEQYADQSVDIYNAFLNVAANQRIVETFQLTADQTVVKFNKVFADGSFITISGQRVDGTYLTKDVDFSVTDVSEITLKRTYPSGTTLVGSQDIKKNENPSSESFYVWNREVITPLVGVRYNTYIEGTRTLEPRIIVDGYHYLPTFDVTESISFTGVVSNLGDGTISIPTDKGNKVFSKVIAEAVPRGDLDKVLVKLQELESRLAKLEP